MNKSFQCELCPRGDVKVVRTTYDGDAKISSAHMVLETPDFEIEKITVPAPPPRDIQTIFFKTGKRYYINMHFEQNATNVWDENEFGDRKFLFRLPGFPLTPDNITIEKLETYLLFS